MGVLTMVVVVLMLEYLVLERLEAPVLVFV